MVKNHSPKNLRGPECAFEEHSHFSHNLIERFHARAFEHGGERERARRRLIQQHADGVRHDGGDGGRVRSPLARSGPPAGRDRRVGEAGRARSVRRSGFTSYHFLPYSKGNDPPRLASLSIRDNISVGMP